MKKFQKNSIWSSLFLIATGIFTACSVIKPTTYQKNVLACSYRIEINDQVNYKFNGKSVFSNRYCYTQGISKSLGMELFKFEMKADSLLFLDRFNKQYYRGSLHNFPQKSEWSTFIHLVELVFNGWYNIEKSDSLFFDKNNSFFTVYTEQVGNNWIVDLQDSTYRIHLSYLMHNKRVSAIKSNISSTGVKYNIELVIDSYLKPKDINTTIKVSSKYQDLSCE